MTTPAGQVSAGRVAIVTGGPCRPRRWRRRCSGAGDAWLFITLGFDPIRLSQSYIEWAELVAKKIGIAVI